MKKINSKRNSKSESVDESSRQLTKKRKEKSRTSTKKKTSTKRAWGALSIKNLKRFSQKFNKNRANKVFKNVNTKSTINNLLLKSDYLQTKKRVFKKFIDIKTKATDQKNSGRCWLFAFLNTIRLPMIKKYKLSDEFEFSQNYLYFYDRLEKANYFFDYIIKNKNCDLGNTVQESNNKNKNKNTTDDIKLHHMLKNATNDGGQWNMFVNLVEKYGLIPKSNMADNSHHTTNSSELNDLYNDFLRKAAHKLSTHHNPKSILDELLYECYKILVIFLGEPPKTINWEYYKLNNNSKKSKTYKSVNGITPLDFYRKYVPYDVCDKVCLINYPCSHVPFYNLYDVELAYSVLGDKKQNYINVPIEVMIDATKKSIDNNEAVWTGIDCSKHISNNNGIMDRKAFNYNDVFGLNNDMKKCDSMQYKQSAPNHAVILRGYNSDKKTNGFLVENSWGEKYGFDGNYYMSLDWFKTYTYQVVIDKKYLSHKIVSVVKKPPKMLSYLSPFAELLS